MGSYFSLLCLLEICYQKKLLEMLLHAKLFLFQAQQTILMVM